MKSEIAKPDTIEAMKRRVNKNVCRKTQGVAEPGNTCLQTPGTCESCPDWWRKRTVKAEMVDGEKCGCCGKDKAKRKGKSPAPVRLIIGQTMLSLCMPCAKKISNCVDNAIVKIESKYVKKAVSHA